MLHDIEYLDTGRNWPTIDWNLQSGSVLRNCSGCRESLLGGTVLDHRRRSMKVRGILSVALMVAGVVRQVV